MKYIILGLLVVVSTLTACAQKGRMKKSHTHKPVAMQGICGIVVEKRGNYMPSPDSPGVDSPRSNPGGTPVEREVLIFPVLNMSQVDAGDNGFINSVRGIKPVKTVKSGKDGKFCVRLPIGQYSVVVQEPKGLYANLSDSHNNINPVTVQKKRQSAIIVEITHQAVF